MVALLFLPSCTTGRLTRSHQACDVAPFTWSALEAPPDNSEALMTASNVRPPTKHQSQIWFSASNERLLLCRIDTRPDYSCGNDKWIFQRIDGRWKEQPATITVCAD
ncbi:hypothetical protein [Noviluteimonas gilva]|uniref:Uncharacterized protein n=1 Tax=Noviluteimonas gilva TaxID=2682097 RepID=A0A7C9LXQ0_9GAMM|nr:hypothetical protein [Lysobacter gilvus]MUV14605.1 hypothetical protein [Lysobacter gilvus]